MSSAPGPSLDCHPLVREHFADRLRADCPNAFRAAHSRLYDYYKTVPKQELPDSIDAMKPLFAALTHGCLAGRHQEALDDVYWKRIRRKNEAYIIRQLGAFGENLAALANFFDDLWRQPAAALSAHRQAVILNFAGFALRAVGRLREATQPMQACIDYDVSHERWKFAAQAAGNLSELWLTLGDVAQAVAAARQSVEFADQSGDAFMRMVNRTVLADALHQAGSVAEAERLFREAEQMQQEMQPGFPRLYSVQGYRFCDLLLSQGAAQEVLERATQTLEWAQQYLGLLDVALDQLSIGRAYLALAQQGQKTLTGTRNLWLPEPLSGVDALPDMQQARAYLNQAVAGLRNAGQQDDLPRGLLARAALFRCAGEFEAARDDLREALEIAEYGGMQLWLVDYHLETARLLNVQLSMSNDQLAEEAAEEARRHVAEAGRLIADTGYHRRDAELAELA